MSPQSEYPSHLFTLRLWKEPLGDGQAELRFQVKHVLSGESRIFRDEVQIGRVFAGQDRGIGAGETVSAPA